MNARAGLLGIGVGAEDFDEVAVLFEEGDSLGDLGCGDMAVDIDEEVVFPRFAFAGAGLDFGHVDTLAAEDGDGFVEGADLVTDAHEEAGAVVSGGGGIFASEDEEAGGVVGVILDVLFHDLEFIELCGEGAGDGGAVAIA